MGTISRQHRHELEQAKRLLEHPGLAIQLTNLLGSPIEKGFERLPAGWQKRILTLTRNSLAKALNVALFTLDPDAPLQTNDLAHKLAVSISGAAGGLFGLPALAIELPLATTIMLRSIADIARCEGEDLRAPVTKLACVEVFALGGRSSRDDAVESAYYAVRTALAKAVSDAAEYLALRGATETAAPPLVRAITQIASRFGTAVSEKAAAQAAPIVGAAGGALINNLFMDHFQNMARGHFTIRRLERIYTAAVVEAYYRNLGD